MTSFDSVKDSGERTQFSTGSQRDSQDGKGRFDLIPFYPQERLAQHFENGAAKYDDDNWKKGQPLRQYVNSAMRHLFKMSEGWTDEDHPAAVAWNVYAFMWTKNEIDAGRLPKELDNIPWQDEPEPEPDTITTWDGQVIGNFLKGSSITFTSKDVNPEVVRILYGGPITVGGPVDDFFDVKEEDPEPNRILDEDLDVRGAVFQALGAASVAWSETPSGVFDSTRAQQIGDELVEIIEKRQRVSVRKIMGAIDGTRLDLTEGGVPTGRTISFRGPALHEDVVKILDALEDAGYEITHAPRT